jgi:pyrroloquinoline quinone biosynthesis protein D
VTSAAATGATEPRVALDHGAPLQLGKQYRLQWEQSQGCHVLLYPEGMVQLHGGAGEIMTRIDGKTTLRELIAALESAFPGADVREDVVEFAEVAHAKGWLQPCPPGMPEAD